jgi:hypothetical protein
MMDHCQTLLSISVCAATKRITVDGKIESGWENEPEQGIEVLPHRHLRNIGLARDYIMDSAGAC